MEPSRDPRANNYTGKGKVSSIAETLSRDCAIVKDSDGKVSLFKYKPPTLAEFVSDIDYLGYPALSPVQFHDAIQVIGPDPEKIFSNGSFFRLGVFLWGKGCVSGETILKDEATGESKSIEQWAIENKPLSLKSLDVRTGEDRVDKVSAPFLNGEEELFEVTLSTGQKISVTKKHRFLTNNGWKELGELIEGDEIVTDGMIVCQECKKELNHMTWTHLRKHSMSLAQYRDKYPWQEISSQNHKSACARNGEAHGMFGRKQTEESKRKNREHNLGNYEEKYGKERAEIMRRKAANFSNSNPMVSRPKETVKKILATKRANGTFDKWSEKMRKTGGYSNAHYRRYTYESIFSGKVNVVGTYELRTCRILDRMIENGDIEKWEYSPDRIKYEMEGISRSYTPDFKLFLRDGSFYYLEVKGMFLENAKRKMEAVKKLIDVRMFFIEDIIREESKYAT